MSGPKVSMGRPGEVLKPSKPMDEMDDVEREAYRREVQERLAAQAAAGNSNIVDIVVESEGYKGTIQMKRPSLDEERQIGIRVAKYLQGAVGVDVKTENIAIFFATFDVCVVWETAPEWFKPREMHDYALLNFIYGRFAEWLRTFRGFVPPEQQGDSEAPAK